MHTPKIVLITGATGDFGQAFADRFAALGCALIVHGRTQSKLDALVTRLKAQGVQHVYPVLCDITDRAALETAFNAIPTAFRPVDLLINNAGGALGLDKIQDSQADDTEAMIAMNINALVRITQLILPDMVKAKAGHVIHIGSTAGAYPYPGGHVYCGVKAFVKQFSLAMRADLQGTGVRVTTIAPGMAETQFSLTRFKGDVAKAAAVYADTTPLMATDIAEAVVWAATQPPHVNVNYLEVMPTVQSFAPLAVERAGT